MKPYYERHGVTVLAGDCLDVLDELADASIDAVVTDPPYGIRFMGQAWDGADIAAGVETRRGQAPMPDDGRAGANGGYQSAAAEAGRYDLSATANQQFQQWCQAWATECLRVLKPGGHMLAFGSPRTAHRLTAGIEDAGFEIRDTMMWIYGQGFPKSMNVGAGLGTALKPAHEPIIVARKALPGTVAANVLAHGTGALNIGACRVEHAADVDLSAVQRQQQGEDNGWRRAKNMVGTEVAMYKPDGRWPPNVLLDDVGAAELDQQSGTLSSGLYKPAHADNGKAAGTLGAMAGRARATATYGDTGGASRFFPVFRWEAKAPKAERPQVDGVSHPTVKPIDLMRWLVRLVTPPGGLVLDPFAGSGTTLQAARAEGFRAVGIEREAAYLPVIAARLDARPRQAAAAAGAVVDRPMDLLDLLAEGEAS